MRRGRGHHGRDAAAMPGSRCAPSSGYPFGLVQRQRDPGAGRGSIVLPRLGRVTAAGCGASSAGPRRCRVAACGRPGRSRWCRRNFTAFGPTSSGDSPRWIHWRTSARRGELMVREFEDTTNDNLLLVVDPWVPAELAAIAPPVLGQLCAADRVLEDTVSLAATICWEWCRQRDDHCTLAIAGPAPIVCSGITGRELAERCLEKLSILRGSPDSRAAACAYRLAPARMPARPGPGDRHAAERAYRTPGAPLAAAHRRGERRPTRRLRFYERPVDHAT